MTAQRPTHAGNVRALLAEVTDLVNRGVLTAHGDLEFEHVFVEPTGRIRLCDLAPRHPDLTVRTYNPHGWTGPAADVAACATMTKYPRPYR